MTWEAEPLTDQNLSEALDFVRSCNPFAQETWGWDTGRFVDWRWGSNTLRAREQPWWFSTHGRLYRRGGRLTALRIAEGGARDVCVITAEPDPATVSFVLDRLIADRIAAGTGLNLDVLDPADRWLGPTLHRAGLVAEAPTGHEWRYDLTRPVPESHLPTGFRLETLGPKRDADRAGIAACIAAAFTADYDIVAGLVSIETNPLFRPELSVHVRSPDGRIAAYCRGTVDPVNGVCGIDPVCTHPDFQRRGLGRAVVLACFANQRRLGGRSCYIGSAAEPAPGTRLYRSLDPDGKSDYTSWSLPTPGPPPP